MSDFDPDRFSILGFKTFYIGGKEVCLYIYLYGGICFNKPKVESVQLGKDFGFE